MNVALLSSCLWFLFLWHGTKVGTFQSPHFKSVQLTIHLRMIDSTTTSPTVTSSSYKCELYGPANQTGTTTFQDVGGSTIELACSSYISIASSHYYARMSASSASAASVALASVITATTPGFNPYYDPRRTMVVKEYGGFAIITVPPYIRPSINPKSECNIYGTLDQKGSIEVGLYTGNTTTSTVVACSDYLTAQSYSLEHYGSNMDGRNYQRSFGRSPECRSYQQLKWTYRKQDAFAPSQNNPPFFQYRQIGQYVTCSDHCQIDVTSVSLFHWATSSSNCGSGSASIMSRANHSIGAGNARSPSAPKALKTVVVDGSTLYVTHPVIAWVAY